MTTPTASELEALRARVSELETAAAGRQQSERLAEALYRIADAASSARDMHEFYAAIHGIVAELMYGENFYIALYDEERQLLNFAYEVDTADPIPADPDDWFPIGQGFARGTTGYVLRTAEPIIITPEVHADLVRRGEIELVGLMGEGDWLGVPLIAESRTLGVLAVQTYTSQEKYTDADRDLLAYVGQHVATALSRARAIEETRQRNAELAVLNSVQAGLAAQLDMQAMYDLVGTQIQSTFNTHVVDIATYDEPTGMLHFQFSIERGERLFDPPMPLFGFRRHVIETGQPLRIDDTAAELAAFDNPDTPISGEMAKSLVMAPLLTGGRASGVVSLQNLDHTSAFSAADVELLMTITSSLGVALENARLVDETRRRAAELEIVNRIAAAVSSQLDLEPLIQLVGEEMWRTFSADIAYVALLDADAGVIEFPYYKEDGRVQAQEPIRFGEGLTSRILASREAMLLNQDAQFDAIGTRGVGTLARSYLGVPIMAGDDAIGVISVQSTEQVGRFGPEDARLLSTIAASVGAAIRNARLYRAQQQSEAQYRRLVEELPLVVYTDRPDETSTSTYISPRVEEIFGYPREAWLEEPFFASVLHPDDRERLLSEIKPALESDASSGSHLYRVIAADGRIVWVRDDVWLVRDEHGKALYVQGFMMDVTKQTLADAEIRRQKTYFESLVASSPVAIVTMDPEGRVTGWNPAASRLFGYPEDEAVGRGIDELLHGDSRLVEPSGDGLGSAAAETHVMTRRARKDGVLLDVELDVVPLVVDGVNAGFYAIYHDVTELHAARIAAEAANQAKSTFLASMSHEIRTPLNAVIGMSGLLLHTELDEEQRDFAETIVTSGEALLTIINDILDFSKIEAGRIELESLPFSLAATLEGGLDVMAPTAAKKGIELAYTIDEQLPRFLAGDAGRLRQIVLNLLSNAVKFTAEGEVVMSATGHRLPRRGRSDGERWELVVEVRDTGIGIPPDRIDRLFQSFSQVDASVARRFGGTGLGLAISRRLAELMDGTLAAESAGVEGEGSTFRLTFRADVAADPDPAASARLTASPPVLAGRRALIVDDNATNRRIVAAQIGRWGVTSRSTPLPSEALEWVRAGERFDVALIDLNMPDIDGNMLADGLRELRPAAELPIVMLSSVGERDRQSPAIAACLTKPVKPSSLHDALVSLLAADEAAPKMRAQAARPALDSGLAERHPLRILLAEDNAVNQKLALRLLAQLGYATDVAANGLEALEALERTPYDLVLMDVQMPEMDGFEATHAIRARWPGAAGPRIVAMTANALGGDREACLAAGMDDYITKPIRPPELAAAIAATEPRAVATNGGEP